MNPNRNQFDGESSDPNDFTASMRASGFSADDEVAAEHAANVENVDSTNAAGSSSADKAHDIFHARIAMFNIHKGEFDRLRDETNTVADLGKLEQAAKHGRELTYYLRQSVNYSKLHHELTGVHLLQKGQLGTCGKCGGPALTAGLDTD